MKRRLFAISCIVILLVSLLTGCSSEDEEQKNQKQMYLRTRLLDIFSFKGAPPVWFAGAQLAGSEVIYDTLEIFPNEEEAEKKYDLWERVDGTIYAVATEKTYEKIDYVNRILEYDGSVEGLKENGYPYPITIDDFVNDIDKLITMFADHSLVSPLIYDRVNRY